MWDMCQMLNIWQISHTKHKKQLPSDVAYMPKLYHLCLYRCKFATVRTNVVKWNNVLYLAFSLHSLLVFIFSLLLTSDPAPPSTKKEQNVEIGFGSWWRSVLGMGHGGDCVWGSRWRSVLGMGHGGDRFWVWVTVEIVFEIGFGF